MPVDLIPFLAAVQDQAIKFVNAGGGLSAVGEATVVWIGANIAGLSVGLFVGTVISWAVRKADPL
ncbi:MAG: hypothetical protein ACFBRM_00190 [Pikeienuella sp.]